MGLKTCNARPRHADLPCQLYSRIGQHVGPRQRCARKTGHDHCPCRRQAHIQLHHRQQRPGAESGLLRQLRRRPIPRHFPYRPFGKHTAQSRTLNKPLYHIAENPADGTITFEYLQDITAGIRDAVIRHAPAGKRIYSLDGRYVGTDHSLLPKGIYVRDGHKFVK